MSLAQAAAFYWRVKKYNVSGTWTYSKGPPDSAELNVDYTGPSSEEALVCPNDRWTKTINQKPNDSGFATEFALGSVIKNKTYPFTFVQFGFGQSAWDAGFTFCSNYNADLYKQRTQNINITIGEISVSITGYILESYEIEDGVLNDTKVWGLDNFSITATEFYSYGGTYNTQTGARL